MLADRYLIEIGRRTEEEAKLAVYLYVEARPGSDGLVLAKEADMDVVVKDLAGFLRSMGAPGPDDPAPYVAVNGRGAGIIAKDLDIVGFSTLVKEGQTPKTLTKTAEHLSYLGVLSDFLFQRYVREAGWDERNSAGELAAAVTNKVFGELAAGAQHSGFAKANAEFIQGRARRLQTDRDLCATLTGAAYNISYARFVKAGGRHGWLSNRFLGYVRALSAFEAGDYSLGGTLGHLTSEMWSLGETVIAPLESMRDLGLFRPLPRNPNERLFYEDVHRLAVRVGVPFKGS